MRSRVILVIIILVCAYLVNIFSSDDQQVAKSSPGKASTQSKFIKKLGINNQELAEEIYSSIANAINTKSEAVDARTKKVEKEHSDLLAITQDKTKGGGMDKDMAVQLIDVLTDDMSATSKVADAEGKVQTQIKHAAIKISQNLNVSDYEARKKVFNAVKDTWSSEAQYFKPEKKLMYFEGDLSLPESDPQYEALLNEKGFYNKDLYVELTKKDAVLPDGAIIPLIKLKSIGIPTGELRDGWAIPPSRVLKNYHERACEPLIDSLVNPKDYGLDYHSTPYYDLDVLNDCPEPTRKAFIEAALMSGWKAIENYVPGNEEWADDLLDQFEDSPYGRPVRNRNKRPLTADEEVLVSNKMQELETEFESIKTGEYNDDYKALSNLKKQLAFEDKKLNSAFYNRAYLWWQEARSGYFKKN